MVRKNSKRHIFHIYCHIKRQPKADQTIPIIMNELDWKMQVYDLTIVQNILKQFTGGANNQRPRIAEPLFCFDVGPPPTTWPSMEKNSGSTSCVYWAANTHLPDSQARCSRGLRPSLAESVLSSTYWCREDDLDIEYSLIFQQNANLMLGYYLRRWLNINPTLPHVTSRVW